MSSKARSYVRRKSEEKAVRVVSEKLNEHENEWYEVPENHLLTIDEQLEVDFSAI